MNSTALEHNDWGTLSQPGPYQSECSLVGSVLNDPNTYPAVRAALSSADPFTHVDHRAIWEAIAHVAEAGGWPEVDAVLARLKDTGATVRTEYVLDCMDHAGSGVNWPYHVKQVNENVRRKILSCCSLDLAYEIRNRTTTDAQVQVITDTLHKLQDADRSGADTTLSEGIAEVWKKLESKRAAFYNTGLSRFDEEFQGLPQAGMVTILGVPGSGKSSLTMLMAVRVARQGAPVRIFSYEMGAEMLSASILAAEAEVPVHRYLRSPMTLDGDAKPLIEAEARLAPLDVAFVDRSLTASQLSERAEVYVSNGVRCIVVDYLQNVSPDGDENDAERIANLCRTCQRLARDHKILVLAVSQMVGASSREDRPPRKSDGMGSAAIEQVSDVILGVYRSAAFKGRQPDESDIEWNRRRSEADIHVLKNKTGPCGSVSVRFEGQWTKFMD